MTPCKSIKPVLAIVLLLVAVAKPATADEIPDRLTVATWNLEWFFDAYTGDNQSDLSKQKSAPSPEEWEWKLKRVVDVIGELKPTILALQEVENREVVRELTKRLQQDYNLQYRIAYVQGWDNFTDQDVAIIYQSGLVRYGCREQTKKMFDSNQYYNLNKHLFATFQWGEGDQLQSLTMLTVHLRAQPERFDIRQRQCQLIHDWIKDEIASGGNVIVLGDLNTEEKVGEVAKGSDMDILLGHLTDTKSDDLLDLNEHLPIDDRVTHINGTHYDRILVSQSMVDDQGGKKDFVFSKIINGRKLVVAGDPDTNHFEGFYEIPLDERDVSDHYPIMAEFLFH